MMKQLLSLITVFVMGVLFPNGATAQNAFIQFFSSDGAGKAKVQLGNYNGNGGWSSTLSGSSLEQYADGGKLYLLPVINYNGGSYNGETYLYTNYDNVVDLQNGTDYDFYVYDNPGKKTTVTLPADYADYDFTFSVSGFNTGDNHIKVNVSWKEADNYEVSYNDGSTWNAITSGTTIYNTHFPFELRKKSHGAYHYFTSTTADLTSGNALTAALTETSAANATKYTTQESSDYGFTLTITDNSVLISNLTAGSRYYLVSDELTGGKRQERFRLIPSRSRDGGPLSKRLFTLNLKDDEIVRILNGQAQFSYHIEKEDGTKYTPWDDNYELGVAAEAGMTDGNVLTQKYDNTTGSEKTNSFALKTGTGVSYTWLFDNSGTAPLTIQINKNSLTENAKKSYYVIGNFKDATHTVNLDPTGIDSYSKMDRLVYYKNTPGVGVLDSLTNFDAATMDSVVYRTTISRPEKGWGELYLVFADGDKIGGNWTGNTLWDNSIYRPQVQNYNNDGQTTEGMDGTALEGGVFKPSNAGENKSQALNPQASSAYAQATSYTLSLNITTSTYRISFNDKDMYILGPAVKGGEAFTVDGWSEPSTALKLTWIDEDGCFKYMGADGTEETPIVFEPGKDFRFAYGKDFRNTWFGEDGTENGMKPADITTADKPYTASGNFYDTQYVNYLMSYRSSANKVSDTNKDVCFGLPAKQDGTGYIIRLYIKRINGNPVYFYTINRKIGFTKWENLTAGLTDEPGYDYYRAFSEWHACKKPEDVKVYTLTAIDAANHMATLTELDGEYIPARTGVIMVSKTASVPFETYDKDPEIGYTGTNLLKAQMDNTTLQQTEDVDGTTYYNYIFKYTANDEGKNALGFYRPTPKPTGRNFAYLHTVENAYGTPSNPAKGFALSFDDATTAINGITTEETKTDGAFYNLQGVKVAAPTQKGVYIRNGKKFVIK